MPNLLSLTNNNKMEQVSSEEANSRPALQNIPRL
jgi:hypothetical protein